jgi:hypothetical protein
MTVPHIPPLRDAQTLTLPGGASMQHTELVEIVQPALAPLMPVFDVLDAVLGLVECVQAVPDTLGPPPNPTALVQKLAELAPKVTRLLGLVPQLSLPATLLGLLDLLIDTLVQVRDVLVALRDQDERVRLTRLRAEELGDPRLAEVADQAAADIETEVQNAAKRLAAMSRLVATVNTFMGVVGGPEVPDLSAVTGKPLEEAIVAVSDLILTLQTVRQGIPAP